MDDVELDPRHLDLLRELADRGSLAAVAAATHRTPSALSQRCAPRSDAWGRHSWSPPAAGCV